MAINIEFTCQKCKKTVVEPHGVNDYPRICHKCEAQEEKRAKVRALNALKKLPVKKRLELVEEALYDMKGSCISILENMRF